MTVELNKEEADLICQMLSFAYSPEIEGTFFDMIYEAEGADESDRLYELYQKICCKLMKIK